MLCHLRYHRKKKYNMNKKGFTLVELLAVIAILALLVIIALPNVLSMFNNAKKDLFLTEAKNVFKESAKKYISDNMHSSKEGNTYCKSKTDSKNPLDMDSNDTYYYIEKDSMGKTTKIVIWNESGYVAKAIGDNVELNSLNSDTVTEGNNTDVTCENVLSKLNIIPKLTKDYTLVLNAEQNVREGTFNVSGKINSSSNTTDFNKVKYVLYRKITFDRNGTGTVDVDFKKIKEFTQSNKEENFAFNVVDEEYNNYCSSADYKIEAYTDYNVKIGEAIAKHEYCFVAGTKVKTESGYKNIEDIKIGEKVYSYNLDTNELELKEVTHLIRSTTMDTFKMTIGNKTIEMSPRHQIYIIDKGWTRAYDVKSGDMMLSINGEKIEITNIEYIKYDKPIQTYNLTVEGNSNYFVTDIQVLVHNMPSTIC